mmetsp:Transcript_22580/g.62841  ORF Transcript_22580/g.62841 Transcript_22580/m.62841 type:complete len:269 (+) Transcript_22580:399-1205(+)
MSFSLRQGPEHGSPNERRHDRLAGDDRRANLRLAIWRSLVVVSLVPSRSQDTHRREQGHGTEPEIRRHGSARGADPVPGVRDCKARELARHLSVDTRQRPRPRASCSGLPPIGGKTSDCRNRRRFRFRRHGIPERVDRRLDSGCPASRRGLFGRCHPGESLPGVPNVGRCSAGAAARRRTRNARCEGFQQGRRRADPVVRGATHVPHQAPGRDSGFAHGHVVVPMGTDLPTDRSIDRATVRAPLSRFERMSPWFPLHAVCLLLPHYTY